MQKKKLKNSVAGGKARWASVSKEKRSKYARMMALKMHAKRKKLLESAQTNENNTSKT